MRLYPEIQRKAQQEIDAVIGSDRIPDLSDKSILPYVDAVVMEVLRWHPAVPICELLEISDSWLLKRLIP